MTEQPTAGELLSRWPRAALSHESAARAHGIELVDDDGGPCRITVPRNQSRVTAKGWEVVRADIPAAQIVFVGGLRMASAVRTVLDLSCVLELPLAIAAGDSALRSKLTTVGDLRAAALGRRHGLARFMSLLDPSAGSVLESLLRVLLTTAGLAGFTTQHAIYDRRGEFVARVDFCWFAHRLIVEADGFAFHSDRLSYRRDRDRMNELERLGWRVLRFTWEDVRSRPQSVVALVTECLSARPIAL